MKSLPLRLVGQRVALGECEAQLELLDDVVADAAAAEILFADSLSVDVVLQDVMEILTGPLVHDEHRLTLRLLAFLVVRQFALLNLDIVFLRQPAQGLRVGDLLVFHQEVDGVATFATGKALADLTSRRDHKRGRLVVMERAEPLVVNARFTEANELTDHINDVDGVHDFVNSRPVYHQSSYLLYFLSRPLTNLPYSLMTSSGQGPVAVALGSSIEHDSFLSLILQHTQLTPRRSHI